MSCFLLGIGSPLVDYSVPVDDEFLLREVSGAKGGTLNISDEVRDELLSKSGIVPTKSAGGAAANTVMALAELGVSAAHFGKIGNDENGSFFRRELLSSGAFDRWIFTDDNVSSGYCLTLITPDAERTMRSNLGASLNVSGEDLQKCDFSGCRWIIAEGYFINEPWLAELLIRSRQSGCRIALDLSSFELAEKCRDKFFELITSAVDLLFANEEEFAALCGKDGDTIGQLLSFPCENVVVKLGANGAIVREKDCLCTIEAAKVEKAVDTTAAGDYFAAGFFWGLAHGLPPEKCGCAGALTAAEIVKVSGTKLNKKSWMELKNILEKLK